MLKWHAASGTVQAADLAKAGELERVLATALPTLDARLGAHERRQKLHFQLTQGNRREEFTETWLTEADGQGTVHAQHLTSHDDAREWVFIKGKLYLRVATPQFSLRNAQGDEVEHLRAEQEGVLDGILAVLGRFAAREESGTTSVEGRQAARLILTLAPKPASFDDANPAHLWRKNLQVKQLTGEVLIDKTSGGPLRASLKASYAFMREGKEITIDLDYASETTGIGKAHAIAPPADIAPPLVRARPLLDRSSLLEGLVTKK